MLIRPLVFAVIVFVLSPSAFSQQFEVGGNFSIKLPYGDLANDLHLSAGIGGEGYLLYPFGPGASVVTFSGGYTLLPLEESSSSVHCFNALAGYRFSFFSFDTFSEFLWGELGAYSANGLNDINASGPSTISPGIALTAGVAFHMTSQLNINFLAKTHILFNERVPNFYDISLGVGWKL